MNFKKLEPINQLESNLFIRHKVEPLPNGVLIQKCVLCGCVVEDYTPQPNSFRWCADGSEPTNKGLPEGYVYINKSGNIEMKITELAITLGFLSTPKEYVDCTIIYS